MPVQYTPQFIKSDVNMMNQMLNQRQQEHDMSLARIAETEDRFGQMKVDSSDIGTKNQKFGEFQDTIGGIIDNHGGDPGAASKDITRALTKFRNDEFFQMAPAKLQAVTEAKKLEAMYGPDAINVRGSRDIQRTPLVDEEGNYMSPDALNYTVYDKARIKKSFDSSFGNFGSRVRQTQASAPNKYGRVSQQNVIGRTMEDLYDSDGNPTKDWMDVRDHISDNYPGIEGDRLDQLTEEFVKNQIGETRDASYNIPGFNKASGTAPGDGSRVVDYIQTGTDKQIQEAADVAGKSAMSSPSILTGKDDDQKSPAAYIGTEEGSGKRKPIEEIFYKLIKDDPELTAIQQNPITTVGFDKELFNESAGAGGSKYTGAIDRYSGLDDSFGNVIALAEEEYGKKVSRYDAIKEKGGLKARIASSPDFHDSLYQSIYNELKSLNPSESNVKLGDDANEIMALYDYNNDKYKKQYRNKLHELVNSADFEKNNEFDFTTLDATTADGNTALNRIIGLKTVTPDMLDFQTGDFVGESDSDIIEAYDNDNSNPNITGIGGDGQNKIMYIVQMPGGEKAIATLKKAMPDFESKLINAFDRKQDLGVQHRAGIIYRGYTDGKDLGNGFNAGKLGSDKIIWEDQANSDAFTVGDAIALNNRAASEGKGKVIAIPNNVKDKGTPYRFDDAIAYLSILQYLKAIKAKK